MSNMIDLIIPDFINAKLRNHLRKQSSEGMESFALLLCGVHKSTIGTRLLTRHYFLPEDSCFEIRAPGIVKMKPAFDHHALEIAERESLVIVHVHTHLHRGTPTFSQIDDREEQNRAIALDEHLNVQLASVVFGQDVGQSRARLWTVSKGGAVPVPMTLSSHGFNERFCQPSTKEDPRFDRQVRAFGREFQNRMRNIRFGLIGVGGLGAIVSEGLSRLGASKFVLVDPDRIEASNLNRFPGATPRDVSKSRFKVEIVARNVRIFHGKQAEVDVFRTGVADLEAVRALSDCDLLIVTTDNHSSRYEAQKIATAFLRPLVNAGVYLEASHGRVREIMARVGVPPIGGPWCLSCGGHIDVNAVARELCDDEHRQMLRSRGYLAGTPAPAVYWVNMFIASQALSAIHNLVFGFRKRAMRKSKDMVFDLLRHQALAIKHTFHEDGCTVCGGAGYRGVGLDAFTHSACSDLEELDLWNGQGDQSSEHTDCTERVLASSF